MFRTLCLVLAILLAADTAVSDPQITPRDLRVTVGVKLSRHSRKTPEPRLPVVPHAGNSEDGASIGDIGRASSMSTSFYVFDGSGAPHPIYLVFYHTGRLTFKVSAYARAAEVQSTAVRADAPRLLGDANLFFMPNGLLANRRSVDQDDLFFTVDWPSANETVSIRLRLRPLRLTRGAPTVTGIEVF